MEWLLVAFLDDFSSSRQVTTGNIMDELGVIFCESCLQLGDSLVSCKWCFRALGNVLHFFFLDAPRV